MFLEHLSTQTCQEFSDRATVAIIMMIAYGHEGISSRIEDCTFLTYVLVKSLDDTYVKLADKAMESFSIATEPGAFLVDFLPACASPHLEYFYLH
jgi:hypothetical protein